MVVAEGPPAEARIEDAVAFGELRDPRKRMRIRGKTPMLSRDQVPMKEAEERRLRGIKLLMEELDLHDELTEEEKEEHQLKRWSPLMPSSGHRWSMWRAWQKESFMRTKQPE